MVEFISRKIWQYLIKYKIPLPFDQAILEIYATNMFFPMVKDVNTRVFTSALCDKKKEKEGRKERGNEPKYSINVGLILHSMELHVAIP